MKVEVDVLGSPSLMVLNVVCGRKATLNLNLRHVLCSVQFGKWGGGGVGGGGAGGEAQFGNMRCSGIRLLLNLTTGICMKILS